MKKLTRSNPHELVDQRAMCKKLLDVPATLTAIVEYMQLGAKGGDPYEAFDRARYGRSMMPYKSVAKAFHILNVFTGSDDALPVDVDICGLLEAMLSKFDSKTACARSIGIDQSTFRSVLKGDVVLTRYPVTIKVINAALQVLAQSEFDALVKYPTSRDTKTLRRLSEITRADVSTPKRIADKMLNNPTPPAPRLTDDISPLKRLEGKRFDCLKKQRYEIRKNVLMASDRFNQMSFADKRKELETLYLQVVA